MFTFGSMVQSQLFDEMTIGRLNPTVVADQLAMLPYADPTEAMVEEIEADFRRDQAGRAEAMAQLAQLTLGNQFKDDGAEFVDLIASFERRADEIGAKLHRLEKRVRLAQKKSPKRDIRFDERLLNVARQDFEDRVDVAVYWRALQAKVWPTRVSESFATGDDIGKALRAAIG